MNLVTAFSDAETPTGVPEIVVTHIIELHGDENDSGKIGRGGGRKHNKKPLP